jgi:uncharacterized protein
MLANKFVSDPHEVVKAGQVVRVKVLEVDVMRKRVALTMRLDDATPRTSGVTAGKGNVDRKRDGDRPRGAQSQLRSEPQGNSAMADALAAAFNAKR